MKLKLFLILIFIPVVLQARVAIPLDNLDSKYQSTDYILMYESKTIRFLGAMAKDEFKELVKGAEAKQQELIIEQNDKVRVIFFNEVEIENNKPFNAEMKLEWLSENNTVIKSVYLQQELTVVKKKENIFFLYYKKVAIYGFPISLGLAIIFFIF